MKHSSMIRKTCLLATLLLPTTALNAATIILNNGDFEGGYNTATGSDFDPNGWVIVETNNPIYVFAPDATNGQLLPVDYPKTTVLHFKDGKGAVETSLTQNLSANNPGLTASSYNSYTVALDIGWRTDTATGNADLRFSLVNLTDSTVLSSFDYSLARRTTPLTDRYELTQAGFQIALPTYDNTLGSLVGDQIGLRIERFDAGTDNNNSTMWMDNITLSAVPEPSAALLGGLGLLALLRRRRAR